MTTPTTTLICPGILYLNIYGFVSQARLYNIIQKNCSLVVVGKIAKVKGIVKLVSEAAGPIKELHGAYKITAKRI